MMRRKNQLLQTCSSVFSVLSIYIYYTVYISRCLQAELPAPLSLDAFNSMHDALLENRASCSRPTRTSTMESSELPRKTCSTMLNPFLLRSFQKTGSSLEYYEQISSVRNYSPVALWQNSECPSPCFAVDILESWGLRAGRFKKNRRLCLYTRST